MLGRLADLHLLMLGSLFTQEIGENPTHHEPEPETGSARTVLCLEHTGIFSELLEASFFQELKLECRKPFA